MQIIAPPLQVKHRAQEPRNQNRAGERQRLSAMWSRLQVYRPTWSTLATFSHSNVAVPLGGAMLVPVAVISTQGMEQSKSTTTLPSFPDDVPVTLITAGTLFTNGLPIVMEERTMNVRNGERARKFCTHICSSHVALGKRVSVVKFRVYALQTWSRMIGLSTRDTVKSAKVMFLTNPVPPPEVLSAHTSRHWRTVIDFEVYWTY